MADANIRAVITAKDEASKVIKGFGASVGGIAKGIGLALGAAGLAAAAFGVLSVKAYSESQDKLAQLNAVLKSTKSVAGVTSEAAIDLSKSLQKVTKYSDENVLSVENLLLTFTSINKKIFPEATKTVLDMATALGEDTKSASIQLGKALQDPVLGITALRRVGVNFSDAQKEVIKKLVETGQKAKAQRLILKELHTEFGGSAEAAGKTLSGALARLKNNFNDGQEALGAYIAKGLTPLVNMAASVLASIDWTKVINNTTRALKEFWQTYLIPIIEAIKNLALQVSNYLQPKLEALWNTITTKVIPAFKDFWDKILLPLIKTLGPIVGAGLVWAIGLVIDALNLLLKVAAPVFDFFARHKVVLETLIATFVLVKASMMLGSAFDAIKIGFATMRLVQIPQLIATLGALRTAFITALPYAAIGAFVVWFAGQMNKIKQAAFAIYEARAAASNDANRIQKQALADFKAGRITKAQELKIFAIANQEADSVVKKKAIGGPVTTGKPYFVGEHGPELFTPSSSGNITPTEKLGGNQTVNITVQAGAFMGSQQDARRYAQIILTAIGDIASSKNKSVNQMLGIA